MVVSPPRSEELICTRPNASPGKSPRQNPIRINLPTIATRRGRLVWKVIPPMKRGERSWIDMLSHLFNSILFAFTLCVAIGTLAFVGWLMYLISVWVMVAYIFIMVVGTLWFFFWES
jgi:hypothetical protein